MDHKRFFPEQGELASIYVRVSSAFFYVMVVQNYARHFGHCRLSSLVRNWKEPGLVAEYGLFLVGF
jgi:hypothetical protein